MKVIVLFKDGCEEIEALSVVDVLRRMNVPCEMVGMDKDEIVGAHHIVLKMDHVFSEDDYTADMVVLPGGMPGASSLRDDQRVIDLVTDFYRHDKWLAAICAAPIVLNKAGVLKDRHYTCYPGFENEIDGLYQNSPTCVDGHMITARGPGAALAFAYEILEQMNIDSHQLQLDMQYQ